MENRLTSNRGVTLIELMIVTVIVGIVSAMAVPRFQIAWERMKIRGANRAITSTIRLARSYAISDKEQYGLLFDGEALTVTLFKDVVNPSGLLFETGDSVIRVDTLPQEYTFLGTDCTNDVLAFRPNGSAEFDGGGNVYAMASTADVVAIHQNNILASTGRVACSSYIY
ncbi:MAG TPA: prepilin-type N-terminal cleavage/methylation domain-containing protein [Acidobacteriota bacterium]|nr:prepilin-type N-terminal cleavage/methylation domain-containing protein [Acidobacteriota bacterium]